jgi:hypothetical protein
LHTLKKLKRKVSKTSRGASVITTTIEEVMEVTADMVVTGATVMEATEATEATDANVAPLLRKKHQLSSELQTETPSMNATTTIIIMGVTATTEDTEVTAVTAAMETITAVTVMEDTATTEVTAVLDGVREIKKALPPLLFLLKALLLPRLLLPFLWKEQLYVVDDPPMRKPHCPSWLRLALKMEMRLMSAIVITITTTEVTEVTEVTVDTEATAGMEDMEVMVDTEVTVDTVDTDGAVKQA